MKLLALFGIALGLTAAAPPAHPHHAPSGGLKFVDLIPAFDRIWNETKDLPDDKRVEAFEADFAKVLPGFYSAERTKDYQTPEQHRAQILRGLKQYPERRAPDRPRPHRGPQARRAMGGRHHVRRRRNGRGGAVRGPLRWGISAAPPYIR